jgi:hypothetical protein
VATEAEVTEETRIAETLASLDRLEKDLLELREIVRRWKEETVLTYRLCGCDVTTDGTPLTAPRAGESGLLEWTEDVRASEDPIFWWVYTPEKYEGRSA